MQLLSIITSDRISFIEKKPSTCADAMSGTESMFEQTLTYSHSNMACILGSYEIVIFDKESRKKLKSILEENLGEALLSLCITKQGVVAYAESKFINIIHYSDILLIYNMLQSSESLSLTESWVPICLPGISDCGYFQMYSNFYQLEGDISLGFIYVTESQESKYFTNFSEQTKVVFQDCVNHNLFQQELNEEERLLIEANQNNVTQNKNYTKDVLVKSKLQNAYEYRRKKCEYHDVMYYENDDLLLDDFLSKLSFSFTKLNPLIDLFDETLFLACRHKTLNQCFTKGFNDYDNVTSYEKLIMNSFYSLYERYNNSDKKMNSNFFYYEVNKETNSVNCIMENDNFILMASMSVFKEFDDANNVMLEISKQIKGSMMQYFCV